MKLKIIFLLAIMGSTSWAQNTNTDKIETLIKVWGFLKYNHPQVATGIIDWDTEFTEKLKKIEGAATAQEIDQVYLDWLQGLKTPKLCLPCNAIKTTAFAGNAAIDWMETLELSGDIKSQLNYVLQNRNLGKNYYVQFHQKTKLPLFNNERKITSQALPNKPQRLLALARYWNAIQYFYPYKHLTTLKWDAVLKEMIPTFQSASTGLEYQWALIEINKYLANSNAFVASDLIFDKIGKKKVPFKLEYIQQQWTVVKFENDSLAALGSLKLGDVITQINGLPVEKRVEEKKNWISASNDRSLNVSIGATLLNGEEDTVALQILREGESIQVEQKRFAIVDFYWDSEAEQNQLPWKSIDDKTMWLRVKDLQFDQFNAFQQASAANRTLILDLRDYNVPSGFRLAEYLVPRSRVFAQMIEPKLDYIGNFNAVARKNDIPTVKKFFTGNTYVLVNEKTRGQAEFLALLFKGSDRITVVGSPTSGTVGYTTKLVLPGEVNVFFTGVGIQSSDGTDIQQKGIQPDLLLELPAINENEKGIADEILAKLPKP